MRLLQVDSKHAAGQRYAVNNYVIVTFGFDERNPVKRLGLRNGLGITGETLEVIGVRASRFYVKPFHEGVKIYLE